MVSQMTLRVLGSVKQPPEDPQTQLPLLLKGDLRQFPQGQEEQARNRQRPNIMKMYSTRDRREKPLLPKGIGPFAIYAPHFHVGLLFCRRQGRITGETASLKRVKRGGPCTKRRNLEAEHLGELLLLLLTGLKQHLSIGN